MLSVVALPCYHTMWGSHELDEFEACCFSALQDATPLYERLQFLAITSSNIDEFFCKRVGGLMRQAAAGTNHLKSASIHKRPPERQLDLIARVRSRTLSFVAALALATSAVQLLSCHSLTWHGHKLAPISKQYSELAQCSAGSARDGGRADSRAAGRGAAGAEGARHPHLVVL